MTGKATRMTFQEFKRQVREAKMEHREYMERTGYRKKITEQMQERDKEVGEKRRKPLDKPF